MLEGKKVVLEGDIAKESSLYICDTVPVLPPAVVLCCRFIIPAFHKLEVTVQKKYSPLADSFFVLIILAAYSCPVEIFMHLLTTEKAPLNNKKQFKQISGL